MRHSKRIKAEIAKKKRKEEAKLKAMGFPILVHLGRVEEVAKQLKELGYR